MTKECRVALSIGEQYDEGVSRPDEMGVDEPQGMHDSFRQRRPKRNGGPFAKVDSFFAYLARD